MIKHVTPAFDQVYSHGAVSLGSLHLMGIIKLLLCVTVERIFGRHKP